jgi:hypothetical protein
MYLLLKSNYLLAKNSVESKKRNGSRIRLMSIIPL